MLCEKPMALDEAEINSVYEAAKQSRKLFLEGYMYRWHPQTIKLVELLRERVIGEFHLIESTFGFAAKYDPKDRLFNPALGGGVIWDIGGYPLSMAMLIAGIAVHGESTPPDSFCCGGVTAPEM